MSDWTDHVAKWGNCQRCPLAKQRDRICLARGTVPCDVLMVGEAPGASEDAMGQPFVGPAGKLLDEIVHRAINDIPVCATCGALRVRITDDWSCALGHKRSVGHGGRDVSYAMTNLVCCFPREAKARGDNEPEHSEILACKPRLREFINLARPRLIVCVGILASDHIGHDANGRVANATVVAIDHPAHILRKPLAQKQMAAQHAVVVLRNAVEDMLGSEQREFVPLGVREHAEGQTRREQLRATYTEADIPW